MGAIKSDSALMDPDRLTARYGGVPIIYVESPEDQYVFGECWFKEQLSQVEFLPATCQCNFDGCNAVIEAVENEMAAGNVSWGIVDRDVCMAKGLWDLVYETDDQLYLSAKPCGNNIKILCRWELESYLMDVEAVEFVRSSLKMVAKRPLDSVLDELLEHCSYLIPHAAINAAFLTHEISGLGDGFTVNYSSIDSLLKDLEAKHISRIPGDGQSLYEQHVADIRKFVLNGSATPEQKLYSLLRRIHGKALLVRFCHSLKANKDNVKGFLANRIKETNRIPEELVDFIETVKNH